MKTLESSTHKFGGETWVEQRYLLDAEWKPLLDEKGRKVHGYAIIEEMPSHMLGRVLQEGYTRWTIRAEAFSVRIYATRNGSKFGAIPRSTSYATLEEAIAYATKALVQQGKRYGKKYGGAS